MIDLFRMVHLSLYQADDQYILKSVFQQGVMRCLGSVCRYDMIISKADQHEKDLSGQEVLERFRRQLGQF